MYLSSKTGQKLVVGNKLTIRATSEEWSLRVKSYFNIFIRSEVKLFHSGTIIFDSLVSRLCILREKTESNQNKRMVPGLIVIDKTPQQWYRPHYLQTPQQFNWCPVSVDQGEWTRLPKSGVP